MSSHVVNICSRKAHRPASNPRRLKAESRQFCIDLQLSRIYAYIRQPRSQSISCRPSLGYLDSIFCKHDATIMLNKSPFGSASHFGNMGSWNSGGNTSNPRRLKSQSRQFFITLVPLLHGNTGPTLARCRNKRPWRPETKKSSRNMSKLHCDRHEHELLGSSEDCKFWVYKTYGEKSFESITDSQLKHPPWRCSSWMVTPDSIIHPYRFSDLFVSWISLL